MTSSPSTPAAKAEAFMKELLCARAKWQARRLGLRAHVAQTGDVHIVTYAKSGTTLLQHLVYQLAVAAGGAPAGDPTGDAFPSLDAIAPWIEHPPPGGPDPNFASSPRVFKTHMFADEYGDLVDDSGTRFIVCVRDGERVPGSLLDMLAPWMLPHMKLDETDARATFDRFVSESYLKKREGFQGGWGDHVRGWTKKRRQNTLVLQFEEVVADKSAAARKIAAFLELDVSEDGITTAVRRCEKQRMAADGRFRGTLVAVGEAWDPEGARKVQSKQGIFSKLEMRPEDKKEYEKILTETFEGAKDYGETLKVIEKWQKQ